jgi:hypothetical protein
MELGGAFCCLGSFFLLERERVVDNFLCSVRMEENFSVDDACPSESTAHHQGFVVLFVVFLSAAGWR